MWQTKCDFQLRELFGKPKLCHMTWQVVLSFAWICSPSEVIELHRSEHASSGPIFVAYSTASWNQQLGRFLVAIGCNWDMLGYVHFQTWDLAIICCWNFENIWDRCDLELHGEICKICPRNQNRVFDLFPPFHFYFKYNFSTCSCPAFCSGSLEIPPTS